LASEPDWACESAASTAGKLETSRFRLAVSQIELEASLFRFGGSRDKLGLIRDKLGPLHPKLTLSRAKVGADQFKPVQLVRTLRRSA
jgi:hypothetical protein